MYMPAEYDSGFPLYELIEQIIQFLAGECGGELIAARAEEIGMGKYKGVTNGLVGIEDALVYQVCLIIAQCAIG